MKSALKIVSMSMLVLAGLLVAAPAARADESVIAKVPFAFVVNGVELPAGEYVVARDAHQPDLVMISSADGIRKSLVLTRAGDTVRGMYEEPKLEFERIGKQVFLSEVTLGPGSSREIALPTVVADEAPRR